MQPRCTCARWCARPRLCLAPAFSVKAGGGAHTPRAALHGGVCECEVRVGQPAELLMMSSGQRTGARAHTHTLAHLHFAPRAARLEGVVRASPSADWSARNMVSQVLWSGRLHACTARKSARAACAPPP